MSFALSFTSELTFCVMMNDLGNGPARESQNGQAEKERRRFAPVTHKVAGSLGKGKNDQNQTKS